MAAKIGGDMKLYYNAGNSGTPTWVEVVDAGDVSVPDFGRATAELKRRGNDYTKVLAGKIGKVSVEFSLPHGLNATVFNSIRGDFFNATAREWAVMDGAINSNTSQGLRLPALVEQLPFEQPLEGVASYQVRLALAYMVENASEIAPSWYTPT